MCWRFKHVEFKTTWSIISPILKCSAITIQTLSVNIKWLKAIHIHKLPANDKRGKIKKICWRTKDEHFGGKFDNPCALFSRIYFVSTFPSMLYSSFLDKNRRVTRWSQGNLPFVLTSITRVVTRYIFLSLIPIFSSKFWSLIPECSKIWSLIPRRFYDPMERCDQVMFPRRRLSFINNN